MIRREIICHIAAAIFSAAIVVPVAFSGIDRVPPFELFDGNPVPPVIKPGDDYATKWRVRLYGRDCDATVYREIIDSQRVVWVMQPAPSLFAELATKGELISVGRPRQMPSHVAEGPIEIHTRTVSVCNWTQRFWPIVMVHPVVRAEVRR